MSSTQFRETEQCTIDNARNYYNSEDADNFYYTIWGGEDIHIGLYNSPEDSIYKASRETVKQMASLLPEINSSTRILDLGAGYGGAARYLAKTYGCSIVALNLSEVENERNRVMNRKLNLQHLIEVVDGSFEDIPFPDDSFDVVWSQDALLHSCAREKVVTEANRVLAPGGHFVFTDPMREDECPQDVLQPILDRIHLDDLGSPGFYMDTAVNTGMSLIEVQDHTEQIAHHYGKVLSETEKREDELQSLVSEEYITRMKTGLEHWINGGRNGHLTWKIFLFQN